MFKLANINEESDTAKQILLVDSDGLELHLYLEGQVHREAVFKFICGSEDTFRKVETAVTTLHTNAVTKRAQYEKSMISPSDYGKHPGRSWILDHRCTSGLHVSLLVEAFGHFIEQMGTEDDKIDLKFYDVAAKLMMKMSGVFPTEGARVIAFKEEVNIFPSLVNQVSTCYKSDLTLQVKINVEINMDAIS